MGACVSLDRVGQYTLRQRVYSLGTSEDAAALLQGECEVHGLTGADSLVELLVGEFLATPPTADEVIKWTRWSRSDRRGSMDDYATTSLLAAHHFTALNSRRTSG